jgi:hypothetical protein
MMTALAGNGINLTQLSDELNVPLDELSSLLYGVAAISGGNCGTSLTVKGLSPSGVKSYKPLETVFSGLLLIASGLTAVILLSNNLHFRCSTHSYP